jgi:hypothetical protein
MPATPDRSDPAHAPEAWQLQLERAFEILLGRPLDSFDPKATYALYHWDDILSAELFGSVGHAAALGSTVPGRLLAGEDCPLGWGQWSLDLGRSLFSLDDTEVLGPSVEAALRAASLDPEEILLAGADLAPLLAGFDDLPEDVFVTLMARIETTGTLVDAMRAASWTMGGPADLVTDYDGVTIEPGWELALSEVVDPGLRRHLSLLCLDAQSARSEGGYYSGVDDCPGGLYSLTEQPGHTFVTGWQFGEGQASSAIFAIDDSAAARP